MFPNYRVILYAYKNKIEPADKKIKKIFLELYNNKHIDTLKDLKDTLDNLINSFST